MSITKMHIINYLLHCYRPPQVLKMYYRKKIKDPSLSKSISDSVLAQYNMHFHLLSAHFFKYSSYSLSFSPFSCVCYIEADELELHVLFVQGIQKCFQPQVWGKVLTYWSAQNIL